MMYDEDAMDIVGTDNESTPNDDVICLFYWEFIGLNENI